MKAYAIFIYTLGALKIQWFFCLLHDFFFLTCSKFFLLLGDAVLSSLATLGSTVLTFLYTLL